MNTAPRHKFGKLYIKRRNMQEWFAYMIFLLPFAFAFLEQILMLPHIIRFSIDLFLVYFCVVFIRNRYVGVKQNAKPLFILTTIFVVYTLIAYIINFQSPFYYLWGARNNFRFYIAFFVFVIYVNENEANNWLKMLDILFWISFVASVVQFLFLNVRQDYLGGIFGVGRGTNGYTLVLLCIVISKSLLSAFNGNEKTLGCILKCVASLLIAAMVEMKFYYFAFLLILIIAFILTKFSWQKLVLLILCIIGVVLGSALLTYWFGSENFLSLEKLWELGTKENYSSANDLNRLSAIFTLSRTIVTDISQRFFGLGLGNCDVSELAIFSTPFSQSYGYLHYSWFSSAILFLETGYIGLILYLSFFMSCFWLSNKQLRSGVGNKLFYQMAMIMSVLCFIITFYNSTLRTEAGYMAYFVLALPFIGSKKRLNQEKNEQVLS